MDEPIHHISASGDLIDNQLSIRSFSGALYDSQSKVDLSQNLIITGSIDFTKFFEPRFDLNAFGDQIFFPFIKW